MAKLNTFPLIWTNTGEMPSSEKSDLSIKLVLPHAEVQPDRRPSVHFTFDVREDNADHRSDRRTHA